MGGVGERPTAARSESGDLVISDPRAIRALAHPARVAVLERLLHGAVLTATECAQVAGLTPSAMSYHLRALERFGLVGRAEPTEDGRERPWRALGTGLQIKGEGTLAGRAAEQLLVERVLNEQRAELFAAMSTRTTDSPDEQPPGTFQQHSALLTAAEARSLTDRLRELFAPYERRSADPSQVPDGAIAYHGYLALAPALNQPTLDQPSSDQPSNDQPSGDRPAPDLTPDGSG